MRKPDCSQQSSLLSRKDYNLVCCAIFVFFLAHPASAQEVPFAQNNTTEPARKNELCLNFFSVVDQDLEKARRLLPDGYRVAFLNGIMYKRHFGQNAWRLGFDSFRDHYKREFGPIRPYQIESNTNRIDLRLGYQRMLAKGKLQPYVGADAFWSKSRTKGTYETELGLNGPLHFSSDRVFFGLSVIAGIAYKPWEKFSISAEASSFVGTSGSDGFRYYWEPLRALAVSYYF